MKLAFTTLILAANIFLISCKKDRTCSCKTQTTTTTETAPRSGGQSTTVASSSTGESSDTFSKVKKDDLKRLYNCNDRTESSQSTYTTMTTVYTTTSVSGYTFQIPTSVVSDVTQKNSTTYDCEIK